LNNKNNCKTKIRNGLVLSLIEGGSRLEVVSLEDTHITDTVLFALAKGSPLLKELNLSSCSKVSCKGLDAVFEACPFLERLRLNSLSIDGNDIILSIAAHCNKLKCIIFTEFVNISVNSMTLLAYSCKSLDHIYFKPHLGLSDPAVLAFAQNCPGMKKISLAKCKASHDTLVTAFQSWPQLEYVNLSWSGNAVSDATIRALVVACPLLKLISLSRCRGLTDEGLYAIADNCPDQLEILSTRRCRFTENAVTYFKNKHPDVHFY